MCINKKFLIAIVISVVSYVAFLYVIFEIFPDVGHTLLPFLLIWHISSIFMMYGAYKGKMFRVPIIGNFAARLSKIDDIDNVNDVNTCHKK